MISLYPYIIPADYYFDRRINKMEQYYEDAKELAGRFNSCHGVSTVPPVPVSNMFHIHFSLPKEEMEMVLIEVQQQTGIGITGYLIEVDEKTCYFEASMGDLYKNVPKEAITNAFSRLDEVMKQRFYTPKGS